MRKNMKNNKTLVSILSILIVALFFGTTLNTTIARDLKGFGLGEHALGENSRDELPEIAIDIVEDEDDGTDKVKEDVKSDCLLCHPQKTLEQKTIDEIDVKSEKLSSLLEKAISVSKDDDVKTLLKALTEEVISIKEEIASIREEIRSLSGVKQKEDYSFDAVFKTEEKKEYAAAFLVGLVEATPYMNEVEKLNAGQRKFININAANKFEQMALDTENIKEKESYGLTAAYLKEDYEKVEVIKSRIKQNQIATPDNVASTAINSRETKISEVEDEKNNNKEDLIKVMSKGAATMQGSAKTTQTSSSSPCQNGERKATDLEMNNCIREYIEDHSELIKTVADKLGIGGGRSGNYNYLDAISKARDAMGKAIELGKEVWDSLPRATQIALVVIVTGTLAIKAIEAGGMAAVVAGIQAAIKAGKTKLLKAEIIGVMSASSYLGGIALLCSLTPCDNNNHWHTSTTMMSQKASSNVYSLTNAYSSSTYTSPSQSSVISSNPNQKNKIPGQDYKKIRKRSTHKGASHFVFFKN
jgi:hypothetical protein